MLFNIVTFVFGFAVLALQPFFGRSTRMGRGMLLAQHDLHTTVSFMTNTNQQHLFGGSASLVFQPVVLHLLETDALADHWPGGAAGDHPRAAAATSTWGIFYLDLWRGGRLLLRTALAGRGGSSEAGGVPMTLEGSAKASVAEAGAMATMTVGLEALREICRGPVAAIIAVKQFGTNGGGYFGSTAPILRKPQ